MVGYNPFNFHINTIFCFEPTSQDVQILNRSALTVGGVGKFAEYTNFSVEALNMRKSVACKKQKNL
ncbi:hypothetical protein C1634_004180 [Chryseobacterium viscerum]|uniref:Uncharacterized protein n=1 Tax=Chryseobacterium viscerum TaxID=1037377 RepID=A0A316WYS0_9FLAO|nr:hypothetical protein C1634_004180 [Chryseobacterium viscerum]